MRIALLSYRSKPHCGGQGVYVRHLSRELAELGHHVEVFSGPPYPELDPRVRLTKVPSLDLYREPDPFRTPRPSELKTLIDVLELGTMWTAGFPEPLTFSLRVARLLRERADEFDVVHDNQCLGYGLLQIQQAGLPVLATIHHPITRDRDVDIAAARSEPIFTPRPSLRRLTVRRWYAFLRMQGRVARRLPRLLTVSESSARDIEAAFHIAPGRMHTIPLGVNTETFAPPAGEMFGTSREPGRIVCTASADMPLKGVSTLLESVAKLRTERDVRLTLVTKLTPGGPTERLIDQLAIADAVDVVSGLDDGELTGLLAAAQVACVPSLYEGFSLPAVEAMSCGTPLVASRAGALPEVVGDCGVLVPPGDSEQLAGALARLLDDPRERARLGEASRRRVLDRYSWAAVARKTAEQYRSLLENKALSENKGQAGDRAC